MAVIIALWWRLEKAAAISMVKIAHSVSESRRACIVLCNFSAPPGHPTAYWYGARVLATCFVMCFAVAAAAIRLRTVPHAMGRILLLGLSSGIMRAEASALRVFGWMLLVTRCERVVVSACLACSLLLTTP